MTQNILIIGNSPCARGIRADLERLDIPTILILADGVSADGISEPAGELSSRGSHAVFDYTTVEGCTGTAGDYQIRLRRDREPFTRSAAAVVIAEQGLQVPLYDEYGLGPSGKVLPVSEAAARAGELLPDGGTVAVFNGIYSESQPGMADAAMECAIAIAENRGRRVFFFTGNLKVSGAGGELLFRRSREAGVVYFKFTHTRPAIRQEDTGAVRIEFTDEITGEPFVLTPDVTVVDERIAPSPRLDSLAQIFRLHRDAGGFLQTPNVRRAPVSTNRRGIFAAGPARSPERESDAPADAHAAIGAVLDLLHDLHDPGGDSIHRRGLPAEIDQNACIRCLTCFRICPHGAVLLFPDRLAVGESGCMGCGICAAQCPRGAIRFEGVRAGETGGAAPDADDAEKFVPKMVIFACEKSGRIAARSAPSEKIELVPVPCGGAVSDAHLLDALQSGADGVLLLACHVGNCDAETGTRYGRRTVERVQKVLEKTGGAPGRVAYRTVAANMESEAQSTIQNFQQELSALSPVSTGKVQGESRGTVAIEKGKTLS